MVDVEVRGRYELADGRPARGWVTFTPRVARVNDNGDEVILVGAQVASYLDATGALARAVQASDDPDLDPPGWTYQVAEHITGMPVRSYDIDVPMAAAVAGIDLVDIAPVSPADGDPTAFVTLTAFTALGVRVTALEGGVAGLPPGGATGQVLTKQSGTDGDADWARITPRVTTIASSATPTIDTDDADAVTITALATAITSMTTNLSGTPTNFQRLIVRIKDDGTARAITWGAGFAAMGAALPTTTVISKVLTVGFIYDTVTSTWGCVAIAQEA